MTKEINTIFEGILELQLMNKEEVNKLITTLECCDAKSLKDKNLMSWALELKQELEIFYEQMED